MYDGVMPRIFDQRQRNYQTDHSLDPGIVVLVVLNINRMRCTPRASSPLSKQVFTSTGAIRFRPGREIPGRCGMDKYR